MKQDWNLQNHITYGEKISWDRYLLVLEKQIILISVTTFELLVEQIKRIYRFEKLIWSELIFSIV